MTDYFLVRHRIFQWAGIMLAFGLIAVGYWYFRSEASTLNQSQNDLNTTGLVGLWSFNGDDISGTTAYDRSGSGNNGTLSGSPAVTQGQTGQALLFDGTDDYVALGNPTALNISGNITVAAWIRFSTSQSNKPILARWGTDESYALAVSSVGSDVLTFCIRVSNVNKCASSTSTYNDNQWHHVVGRFDGANARLTIDVNREDVTGDATTGPIDTPAQNVTIGTYNSIAQFFNGSIDEVRVYNAALSASQIQSLYALGQSDKMNSSVSQPQGTGRLDSGLAGYWALDNGSGTSATDSSTNGNTGTLTNGPTWGTGQIGSAVDFDGTDDYIATTDYSFSETQPFTFTAWFKPDTVSGNKVIFAKPAPNYEYTLRMSGASLNFTYWNTSAASSINLSPSDSLVSGTWYLATVTQNGSQDARLYLNGALAATDTSYSSLENRANNLQIGGGYHDLGSAAYFDGLIDEVRVYNRALSADEVANLYRLTSPTGVDTGLKGYWSFNAPDTTSTSAFDRSGAGNTGTLTNSPSITEGKMGQGLDMNGSNQYISIADNSSLDIGDTDDLTLTGWFYRDTFTTDDTIMAKRNGVADTDDGYILFIDDTTDKLTFEVSENSGADEYLIDSKITFTSAGWHHFAVVWDQDSATNSEIYINGTAGVATDTGTIGDLGDLGNSVALALGAESDAGNPFDGRLDEMRLYKRALTVSEIKALYDAGESDKVNSAVSQPQGTGRLDSGLAGYWALDNGSGTSATDSSTNGNTGTLTNGPTWTTGQIGSAVTFDGSNDYIDVPDASALEPAVDITIAAWIYPTAAGSFPAIVSKSNTFDEGSATKYALYFQGGGTLLSFASGGNARYTSLSVPLNQWSFVAVTQNSARGVMYLNGQSEVFTATAAPSYSTETLKIGRFGASGYFNGNIDEVRIYNRVLSANELADLARLSIPTGVDTNLKGYWSYNGQDISGTTAFDRSGAGNNGTLTSGPTITEGKLGQGLSFDGTDDYVNIPYAKLDFERTDSFSVSGWARLLNTGGSQAIFGRIPAIPASRGVAYGRKNAGDTFGNAGSVYVWIINTTATNNIIVSSPTNSFPLEAWKHVVFTYDGSSSASGVKIYIDGANQTLTTHYNNLSATIKPGVYDWRIGDDHTNDWAKGTIDEVRVYNRVLSAIEVAALYNSSR